ncbi:hypothetical protein PIB30_050911 [Stylosanthes scabra]|uniref:DUF4283 domain-containing protein n=1 Tax=Stylosanthes scabra TaxID=79078 RepID=A0ABU6ZGH9_9FABA|nr:hypothetical protein [Stylosanthes scabra]
MDRWYGAAGLEFQRESTTEEKKQSPTPDDQHQRSDENKSGRRGQTEERGKQKERTSKDVVTYGKKHMNVLNLREENIVTSMGNSVLALESDEELKKKLRRSIIGEAISPLDSKETMSVLMKDWCEIEEVKLVGIMKAMMTFDTEANMEAALNSSFLLNHFVEVRKWSLREASRSRKAWLNVYGFPLHAWTKENMEKVGRVWGAVIKVEDNEESQFSYFKVLVDTGFCPLIQARLNVDVESEEFLLFVTEAGSKPMDEEVKTERIENESKKKVLPEGNKAKEKGPTVEENGKDLIGEDEELCGREDGGADESSRADVDGIAGIANVNNSNFELDERFVEVGPQRNGLSQWNSEKKGAEDEESKTKT